MTCSLIAPKEHCHTPPVSLTLSTEEWLYILSIYMASLKLFKAPDFVHDEPFLPKDMY